MASLSLREAAKHFDVSRPTLQKALKTGKISGVQDGQGHWTIDPAELARIYRPRSVETVKPDKSLPVKLSIENTPLPDEVNALKALLAATEQRAAVAEALAEERGRHIDDLRRMLPTPASDHKRRKWWPWT